MNYEAIAWAVAYLVVGYGFTVWFINYVLENKAWADGNGEPVGMLSLLGINLAWGFMAFIMLAHVVLGWLTAAPGWLNLAVKRLYGVNK